MAQPLLSALLYLLLISLLFPRPSFAKHNNVTDRHALVSFKSMITSDPSGSLASWNGSLHFCRWPGVSCSGARHPQRVISLNLSSLRLTGSISPAIANLSFLNMIDLSDNRFQGPIPQEIGRLLRLQHLNLSANSLEGVVPTALSSCSMLQVISLANNLLRDEVPSSLFNCSNLRTIDLSNNSLTGCLPSSYSNLSSLSYLYLYRNQLSGDIPTSIANLGSLLHLYLNGNQFSGSIPPSLGRLSKVTELTLYDNNLTGTIPPSLWNLSSLVFLDLSFNSLSGLLPPNLGQDLPLLERICLANNRLHGPIPTSFFNASRLEKVTLSFNRLSGAIPSNIGSLQNLQWIASDHNQLGVRDSDALHILTALANCTKLWAFDLSYNNLEGTLPYSIANFSTRLFDFGMGNNYISGEIPSDIGSLLNLTFLNLGSNLLVNSIPDSVGRLRNLHFLDFSRNKLSGKIPSAIGNLSQLNKLFLDTNELSGSVPAHLGNCLQLNILSLGMNRLSGAVPKEILEISALGDSLDLSHNSLTGVLPSEVGRLINLVRADFSFNKLYGQIPSALSECVLLRMLDLSGNFFHGSIPLSLASLRGIERLGISRNNLSGRVPEFLQDLEYLHHLDLSFNNFEGEVPRRGVFENTSAFSVLGNAKLCGWNPVMKLPPCPSTNKKRLSDIPLVVSIAVASISFVLFCLIIAYRVFMQRSKRKPLESSPIRQQHAKVSYAELLKATNDFSNDNLIGIGSFGTVYKGMMDDDSGSLQVVAVKVLDVQLQGASKSFIAECEALRNFRHRNLLRIVTVCSSADFQGNDFKAIVSEFMANGSLDYWLHCKKTHQYNLKMLSLVERINIALDVATALDYLHSQCERPIVHCDLKPSNVLLDSDMTAYVGDFGLSKILEETTRKSSPWSTNSVSLKGTIGYIPPEYGMVNWVSIQGDVYSYGILLLEMFTAKRPTDEMFEDGFDLRKFVESSLSDWTMNAMDAQLLLKEHRQESYDIHRTIECVASIFKIGITCSSESPANRMKMGEVIGELCKIRNEFVRNTNA